MSVAPAFRAMAMRSGAVSIVMMRSAPSTLADWIANIPTGPAPPDRDDLSTLNAGLLGCLIASGENVGQEERFLIRHLVRHFHRRDIGHRHPHIFRLAACVTACEVGVTKQTGRRVGHQGPQQAQRSLSTASGENRAKGSRGNRRSPKVVIRLPARTRVTTEAETDAQLTQEGIHEPWV